MPAPEPLCLEARGDAFFGRVRLRVLPAVGDAELKVGGLQSTPGGRRSGDACGPAREQQRADEHGRPPGGDLIRERAASPVE